MNAHTTTSLLYLRIFSQLVVNANGMLAEAKVDVLQVELLVGALWLPHSKLVVCVREALETNSPEGV